MLYDIYDGIRWMNLANLQHATWETLLSVVSLSIRTNCLAIISKGVLYLSKCSACAGHCVKKMLMMQMRACQAEIGSYSGSTILPA